MNHKVEEERVRRHISEEKQVEKIAEKHEEPLEVTIITETLKKLKEQIDIFPEFYARLEKLEAQMQHIEEQQTILIGLLKVKYDLDMQEKELMDLAKQTLEGLK